MTPNEKAEYLVNKCNKEKHFSSIEQVNNAKFYANLIVDEIINSWNEDGNKRLDESIIYYWKQVKTFLQ